MDQKELSQHTVQWRPWGKAAFKEAMDERKPILLSLGAVWCHWCHVMDKTSFSDPAVVELINSKFIPIRVDIDKRPDIRDRYNFGGYPTTAILNGKGHVLTGATFVPPRQLENMLGQIHQVYTSKYDQMLLAPSEKRKPPEPGMDALDENIMPFIVSILTSAFDAEMGGFSMEPKFPAPSAITLLLLNHARTGEAKYIDMATLTLNNMKRLLDEVEGGLFRYSVTRDWATPHYEKMLDTNAGALMNYLDAFSVTGNAEYKRVAQRILDYIETTLCDGQRGGFYGSQDADEEYYKLATLTERKKANAPFIDKTIYADSDGQMICAFFRAAVVLDKPRYHELALKGLGFLMKNLFVDKSGMYHYYTEDGKADVQGIAADNVWCALACIAAYEHTADVRWLTLAEKLAAFIARNLVDKYGLHDRLSQPDDLGELANKQRPLEDNTMAAHLFTSLAILTDNEKYMKTAETILLGLSGAFETYGHLAASYAIAVEHFLHPVKIIIIGKAADDKTKRLWHAALKAVDPCTDVLLLDVEKDKKQIAEAAYPTSRLPVAFLCAGKRCSPPLLDEGELQKALKCPPTASS